MIKQHHKTGTHLYASLIFLILIGGLTYPLREVKQPMSETASHAAVKPPADRQMPETIETATFAFG